ncbi:MAG: YtxH domain-containing protein [Gracilimonas sp.]|uniref:YtxH domain-containing protein n=1 Tax=Gracilimonas sp. TaxID=1974203 RepID=UPI0037521E3C|nr:YtxH domain-containing protein [Gracilimonas sp.]
MKRGIGALLFGATAFAGGVIAGLLLTPKSGKENLRWLEVQGRKLKKDGEMRIDQVSKGIKKTVEDTFPDLYAATENLDFSEEEEIEEITKHG